MKSIKSFFFVSLLCLLGFSAVQAKTYKPTFKDTYLDRLFQTDSEQYLKCMLKGPTDYHLKGALCARATRLMLSCARAHEPEVYCGGYAFSYYGNQCMERRGYINLLEHVSDPEVCQVPGAMWVFYGRCNSKSDNGKIPSVEVCHQRIKKLIGIKKFERELNSKIKTYTGAKYGMTKAQAYRKAFAGDRYGHMDLIGYPYNKNRNSISKRKINFWSYLVSSVPASHSQLTGKYHGKRILKACYLPREDANRVLSYWKK